MNRNLPAPIVSRANRNLGGSDKLTGTVQTMQGVKFPLAKGYVRDPLIIIIGSFRASCGRHIVQLRVYPAKWISVWRRNSDLSVGPPRPLGHTIFPRHLDSWNPIFWGCRPPWNQSING